MCKIMIIPGVKPALSAKAWEFAKAARPGMTKDDNHAFGYAALGSQGLFGQRWIDVNQAFRTKTEAKKLGMGRLREIFGDLINLTDNCGADYSEFGERSETVHSILLHARWATCGRGIENAHPFVNENTALIHNGVISNSEYLQNKISTCDSETILNEYLDADVATEPERIQDVADKLAGWFAVAVLAPHKDHGYVVDIFKGQDNSTLYAGFVMELDTVVFATLPALITKAAKRCAMHVGTIVEVPADVLIRLNAYTGETVDRTLFESGWLEELAWYNRTKQPEGSKLALPASTVDAIAEINDKLMPIQPDVAITDEGLTDEPSTKDEDDPELAVDDYIERTGLSYSDAAHRAQRRWRGKR